MLLSDFYTMMDDRGLDSSIVDQYFQQAYEGIVEMLRLDQSIHPVKLIEAGHIGGFDNPVIISSSESKMCFKAISKYLKGNLESSTNDDNYTINNISTIDPTDTALITAFASWKNNDGISIKGTDIVATDAFGSNIVHDEDIDCHVSIEDIEDDMEYDVVIDDQASHTYIMISGYVYPYPLLARS